MKKWNWLSFLCGIIIGVLIVSGIGFYAHSRKSPNNNESSSLPGLTLLKAEEQGSVISTRSIKVMQTLTPKMALAFTESEGTSTKRVSYLGTLVLYIEVGNSQLYDDQIIEIPKEKQLVRVGTYKYETREKIMKTVPAVSIK